MRAAAVALLAGLLAGAAAPAALGHALLVRSSPSSRATLHQPPERVSLWFNERLEAAYSTVSVWDAQDSQIDLRDAASQIERPRHRRTRGDQTCRCRGIDAPQRATCVELSLLFLERVGELRQR